MAPRRASNRLATKSKPIDDREFAELIFRPVKALQHDYVNTLTSAAFVPPSDIMSEAKKIGKKETVEKRKSEAAKKKKEKTPVKKEVPKKKERKSMAKEKEDPPKVEKPQKKEARKSVEKKKGDSPTVQKKKDARKSAAKRTSLSKEPENDDWMTFVRSSGYKGVICMDDLVTQWRIDDEAEEEEDEQKKMEAEAISSQPRAAKTPRLGN